jgi:hypothetical protein
MTTIALNNLWNYIQGLSLSARNEEWLAQRLQESSAQKKARKKDDSCMSREEFFNMLDESEREIERGEGISFSNREDMNAWLESL